MRVLYTKLLAVFIFLGISFLGFGQCPNISNVNIKTNPTSCFNSTDGIIIATITSSLPSQFKLYGFGTNTQVSTATGYSFSPTYSSLGFLSGTFVFTISGLGTGTYDIRYQRPGGCNFTTGQPNSLLTNISVAGPETVSAGPGYDDICKSNGVQYMFASNPIPPNGNAYLAFWTISGPGNPSFDSNIDPYALLGNLTEPGAYTVTWNVSISGCGSLVSDSQSFNVYDNPSISSLLSSTVCSGIPFNYNFNSTVSGSSFSWKRNIASGISNSSATGSNNTISEQINNSNGSTAQNAFYILSVLGPDFAVSYGSGFDNCPGIPSVLTVTVNPTPVAISTPSSDAICSGQPVNFTLSSNLSNTVYSWITSVTSGIVSGINSGSGSLITDSPVNTTNASASYDYIVTPQNTLTGCSALSPFAIPITINPLPTVAGTNTPTVCGLSSIIINLNTNGTGFNWSSGQSTNPATLTPSALGLNTFTATVSSGLCSVTTTVGIYAETPITVQGINATVCGLASANISLLTNGASINWFDGSATNSIAVLPAVFGINNYPATITSSVCSVTTIVGVLAQPLVTVTSVNSTVCGLAPTSVSLATNGTSFLWNTGQTTNPAILTPTIFGLNTFTATVTSGVCSVVTTVGIESNALITISAPATTTVCGLVSASVTLTTNGTNFIWSNGQTTNPATLTPSTFGLNTFIATVSSGLCSATTTVGVFATNFSISVSGNPATPVCSGSPINVTASSVPAGASFDWTAQLVSGAVSGYSDVSGSNSINQTLTSTGLGIVNYSVTGTLNGCQASTLFTVTVNPFVSQPSFISGNARRCQGPGTDVYQTDLPAALNATSIAWSVSPALAGTNTESPGSQHVTTINWNAAYSGNVTLTAIANGCGGSQQTFSTVIGINVSPNFISQISQQNNSCIAANGIISATVLSAISGISLNNSISGSYSNNIGTFSNLSPGLYFVVVRGIGASACTATSVGYNITSPTTPAAPVVVSAPAGNYCSAQTIPDISLTVPTGSIGFYQSGVLLTTTSTLTNYSVPTGVGAYNYSANVTVNGCVSPNIPPIDYTVNISPTITGISGTDPTACNSNDGSITVTGAAAAFTLGAASNATGIFTNLAPITHTVVASNGSCTVSGTLTLTAPGQPSPPILAGGNTYCAGQTITQLTATSTVSGTFGLYNASNILVETQVGTSVVFNTTSAGTYYANISVSGCGSAQSNSESIIFNPSPTIIISGNTPVCIGNIITVTANAGIGANYDWSDGQTGNIAFFSTSGPFAVNATLLGCSASLGFVTTVNSNPLVSITPGSTSVCANSSITFNGNGANTYTWLPSGTTAPSLTIGITTVTTVSVIGTDLNGCVASDEVTIQINSTITVLDIPVGNTSFCSVAQTLSYSLPNVKTFYNASTINWTISPAAAGTITVSASPNEHITSVDWNAAFSGIATISVVGIDACGNSSSNFIDVTVTSSPTIASVGSTDPSSCSATDGSITISGIASSGSITYINLTSNTTIASGIFDNLSASPTSTYNFTLLDVINGCSVNTSASLNPTGTPPTPSIAGGNNYCTSDIVLPIDVTSSVSGNITIYIVPGIFVASTTGTSLSIIPSVSGDYFATLATGGCISNNSPTETVAFNSFVIQPNSPNPVDVCVGGSTPLSIINGTGFYSWTGDILDIYFGTDVNATPTAIGLNFYTVSGIGENGCTGEYIFTVNGVSPPTISLTTANQTICGDNIDLSFSNVGGATSLTYFDGTSETTIAIVGNSFNVPLVVGSNDFTLVSVSGGLCGSGIASGTVNIYRRDDTDPICTCSGKGVLIGGSGSVCEGGSSTFNLVISVSGISPLSVEIFQNGDINNMLTFSGLNPGINSNLAVSPSVTTDYTIYAVNTASCQGSGSGSIRINVTPVPLLSVTSAVTLNCSTNSADLNNYFVDLNTTLVGTVSYWSDANYTVPISNTVTTSGTYYIRKIASGLSTCTGEAAITVTFQSTPTGQIFGGGAFCSGQNASLNFQFTGGSAPYSFTYGNATLTSAVITSSGIYTTNVTAENTIYTVSGITDANGCAISSSGSAIVSLNPTSLCGGNVICTTAPSAPILLSQQVAPCGEIKVAWTTILPLQVDYFTYSLQSVSGNVFSTGTTLGFNTSFTGLGAGTYDVLVSASNSCGTSLESTLLGINATSAIGATITGGGLVCASQKVVLNIDIQGGVAPFTVNLTNGTSYINKPANFNITVGGLSDNYTVQSITDASGCSNLVSSIGTDVTGIFPQAASVAIASKFNSSCQGGIFVFTATGANGGINPSFVWKVNNTPLSLLGVNYTVVGLDTLGNVGVISITGFSNNDAVSVQMFADTLLAGCVLNASSIISSPINISIENINLQGAISYLPTNCNNSDDGVLLINLPSKYFGRSFSYQVYTVAGTVSNPLISVPGLPNSSLNIKITDLDNPQCTLDTTTGGTGSIPALFSTSTNSSGCNESNGSISVNFVSNYPSYNATLLGLNTTSGLSVVSVVSNIANNSTAVFDKLAVGVYQLNVDYNNCSETLKLLTITGGGAPVVDLGPDRNICKGDSIVITTSGIGGGLFTWISNDSTLKASPENFLGVKPLQNTVYSVVVPGSSGCFRTDFITINVAEIKMLLATTTLASDTSVKAVWTYVNKTALPDTLFRIESRTISNNVFSPWVLEDTTSLKDTISISINGLTKSSVQQYRIIARNNAVCASAPHDLIYLSGLKNEDESKVSLNWSPYKGWINGVDHYEVWRKTDEEAGFSFFQNAALDTTIEIFNVSEGFQQEYRILAISKEPVQDSIKSWSNIISITFLHEPKPYNAFSPNGDDKNQYFEVENILSYANNEIFIFNRWGGKVYYAKPYKNDWSGDGMPDGTYFFIINLNDKRHPKPLNGSVLLQR